jgi:hypothetical protein
MTIRSKPDSGADSEEADATTARTEATPRDATIETIDGSWSTAHVDENEGPNANASCPVPQARSISCERPCTRPRSDDSSAGGYGSRYRS